MVSELAVSVDRATDVAEQRADVAARRPQPERARWARPRHAATAMLVVHAALVFYSATQHSPVYDEVGYLPAGLSHWQLGRFDLYNANPPLVRMVATCPLSLSGVHPDWRAYDDQVGARAEFYIGQQMLRQNPHGFLRWLIIARSTCILFCVLGAWCCWTWARELYGDRAGLIAVALWCFSPNVLAHGQLITPDVGGMALGIVAAYALRRSLMAGTPDPPPGCRDSCPTAKAFGLCRYRQVIPLRTAGHVSTVG